MRSLMILFFCFALALLTSPVSIVAAGVFVLLAVAVAAIDKPVMDAAE